MGLICLMFGHKAPTSFSGSEYHDVHVGQIDGIGRVHARLYGKCERCEKRDVPMGAIHVPYVSALCARGGLAKSKPVAYAIRNGDGYWSGIWNDLETANSVLAKGLKSNKEKVIPLYTDMQTSDHDIRIGRYVRKMERTGGPVSNKLMTRLIENALLDEDTAGIGRMA